MRRKSVTGLVGVFVVAAAALGLVLVRGVAPVQAQEVGVSAVGNQFLPGTIAVPAGTTVVWRNEEADPANSHDLNFTDEYVSPLFYPGEFHARTFWTPGVYYYWCSLHYGMEGAVVVE